MADWHYFREPLSGLYGRLRRIPGVEVGGGNMLYGVEVATQPKGEFTYVFVTAGRTPEEAVARARMTVRSRFHTRAQ